MKGKLWLFCLLCGFALLVPLHTSAKLLTGNVVTQKLNLPPFDAITVGSGIDVLALTNQPRQSVEVTGDKNILVTNLIAKVENHTLYLSLLKFRPLDQRVFVNISMQHFSSLNYSGNGRIRIQQVKSNDVTVAVTGAGDVSISGPRVGLRRLDYRGNSNLIISGIANYPSYINYEGHGDVSLLGTINPNYLNLSGDGHLKIDCLNSERLNISSKGNGVYELGGRVSVLNVNLGGCSHLDVRHLAVGVAFIATSDKARVDVLSTGDLYTLAKDNSNIYYFNHPCFVSADMRRSGTVLFMQPIPGAYKHF